MSTVNQAPLLQTARLTLSPLRPTDAQVLLRYRSLPEVARYQEWSAKTEDDARRFISEILATPFNQPDTWYQLGLRHQENDTLIGDVGLHFLDVWQMELGITLNPTYQRQGLATEALTAVLTHLFCVMNKHRVTASIDPENQASRRLFTRLGFQQEAHFRQSLHFRGEWVDDVIYAMLQEEYKENYPCPP